MKVRFVRRSKVKAVWGLKTWCEFSKVVSYPDEEPECGKIVHKEGT